MEIFVPTIAFDLKRPISQPIPDHKVSAETSSHYESFSLSRMVEVLESIA